jgi:GT2 family glycosyltransferase
MVEATIVIPTYFGNQMLAGCINSILKNVVLPKIWVFKNDIGWLKACNKAMHEVSGDIIILNDDTLVLTDIVQEMSALAYSDPKIGIVGGVSLAPNGETINNYGIYVAPDGNTAHKYFGQPKNTVQVEKQQAVEGSCMFIKREVIDTIGYFDEEYGAGYREEVDFCFRAREQGFKVVSCPSAEYIHFVNQTHSKVGITNDKFDYFNKKWGAKLKLGKL